MAEKEKRNPSIVDVAKSAGVSAGTVSRVINSNPKISAATVKRVVCAMNDLGYEPPHPTRRRGKSSRAQQGIHNSQVAVVPLGMGDRLHTSPVITKTWNGIRRALERLDLSMVVPAVDNLSRLPAILDPKQTDGVILEGRTNVEADKLRQAFEQMPSVFIFSSPPGMENDTWFDQVMPDNQAIGQMALDYLTDRNRSRLVFIHPNPADPASRARAEAFSQAAESRGCSCHIAALPGESSTHDRETVSAFVDALLDRDPRPDGLFIPNDHLTAMVQVQLLRRSIVPGKDISLVSCNNEEIVLAGLYPRPATIDIRPELVGDRAVDQLLWRMANRSKPAGGRITIPPKLIEGDL